MEDFCFKLFFALLAVIIVNSFFYLIGVFITWDININNWALFSNTEKLGTIIRCIIVGEFFLVLGILLKIDE